MQRVGVTKQKLYIAEGSSYKPEDGTIETQTHTKT